MTVVIWSKQKMFCNCCGEALEVPLPEAVGRDWRCCSEECYQEMKWREALSNLGKPYEPQGGGMSWEEPLKASVLRKFFGKK